MIKLKPLVMMFMVFSLCLLGCSGSGSVSSAADISTGGRIPDFTLNDLNGKSVAIGDFLGKKALVLVFTTTWCSHCVTIIPDLKGISSNYKNSSVKLIAVYARESKERVKAFAAQHGIPYTILLDTDGSVAAKYGIRGVPTIVVTDKGQAIAYKGNSIPLDLIDKVSRK